MTYSYIGLGSNRGKGQHYLHTAARQLKRLPGARLTRLSPLYGSAPLGCPGRQNSYCNAVAELQTTAAPQRLFYRLRRLEKSIQKKSRRRNNARRLDIDYLAHGRCRRHSPMLTLPHPRMEQRAFVLRPLSDILNPASCCPPINPKRLTRALAACRNQKTWQLS